MNSVRVVFLDRDGVINEQAPPHQYILSWKQFKYLPGVYEAIGALNKGGYKVIIVTNQRCVARGLATIEDIEDLNRRLIQDIAAHGGKIDAMYYCPHDDTDQCECRKPKPGMLIKAEKDLLEKGFKVDKERSWMIGDFWSDIQTGVRYGVNTIRILSGGKDTSTPVKINNDGLLHLEADSLLAAAAIILEG